MHPAIALATLTLLVAAVFFTEGVVSFLGYHSIRDREGAGWLLMNCIVTLLLSAAICWQFPSVSTWFIGPILGINRLVNGWSRFIIAEVTHRMGGPAAT